MVDFKKALADKKAAREILEAQIKAARDKSSPSMDPWSGAGHKKKEPEPPPPDIRELDVPDNERGRLTRMIEQVAAITKTQGTLKKQKTDLVSEIKPLCKLYGLGKFMADGNRSAYYKQTKATISRQKLIEHGITPDVITACTVISTSWAFKTSGPDMGDGNGDEED
jgi:hypothetical protein